MYGLPGNNNLCWLFYFQEKQLQVNMKINKLRETVKAQQEKVTNHECFDSKFQIIFTSDLHRDSSFYMVE
jgi:hypothetical protein